MYKRHGRGTSTMSKPKDEKGENKKNLRE